MNTGHLWLPTLALLAGCASPAATKPEAAPDAKRPLGAPDAMLSLSLTQAAPRATWVEDTVRLMERLTPDGALVVGHSLGGWISLALSSIAPGLAKKIVSEDPYIGPNSLVGDRARGDASRRLSRPDAEAVESATSIEPLAAVIAAQNPHYSPEVVERLATMQFRLDPVLIRGRGTRSEPERNHDEMFPKIGCPVLLMHGNPEKGGIMDDVEAARVAGLIPDAQVVSWPHTGHNLHVARNFDFVKTVRRFLKAE